MAYYLAHTGAEEEFLGQPFPSVGARVVFDIDRLSAARERSGGRPVDRRVTGDEGLVVHDEPMGLLTVPDRLWRVDDLQGLVRLQPGNYWLRCRSLTVVDEVPTWLVMGPHGASVAQVIDQAAALTGEQAGAIAAMDATEEERLVGVVWERWLHEHSSGSPVGCGLVAVHNAVTRAARQVGPELFGWDEEDGVEVITDSAWQEAGHAAGAAALGLGAPGFLNAEENHVLARRWTTVMAG